MMAGYIVSSGQVSIGSSVIGETLVDYGLVINTLVGSGGNLQVDGTATGTVVSAGGVEDAGAYGYNGVAIASVVLGGGQSIVVNSAVSATISSGGSQFIDGGVAFNTVLNGGVEVVETQLYVGGPAIIGSSINTVINNGGLEFVNSGAIANATIINSGGTLVSAPGAVVIDAVNNGGQVISTGSVQLLANGGFLVGVTPLSGTVSDDTVSILSGLGASGLSLTGTTETIFSGGVTIGTTIGLGSTENISSGGVASGTIVSFGNDGETVLAGGKSISSLVMSGATESVDGIAIGTTVYTGGTVSVYSARSATSIGSTTGTVLSGGTEIVTLGSATSTIVLAGGVLNDGAFASATIVSSGGTELLTSGAVTAGEIITPNGSLSAVTYPTGSSGTASGTVVSNGGVQMVVDGLAVGATILSGGIQSLTSSGLASSTTVSSGGTEIISAGGRAIGTTLAVGAMIDLPNVEYISGATAAAASGGVLTVMEYGVTTYTQTLAGTYTGDMVSATQDSGIGTLLTILAASPGPVNVGGTPCYCRGTLILTDQGERPVETLAIGDRLVTQSGALRPIRWIGRRSYAGRFANGNATVLPVCFKAGSLAAGQPRRDLFVSPLHAMAIDGVLIPAALLVNGITILQADTIDQVDYIHLELDTHDVIWAEGAASETFIDDGSRGMFHNAQDYAARYPDADRQSPQYCAPRLESGAMLEAIKLRLAPRPHLGTVRGVIDMVTHDRIAGWACMPGQGPLRLSVTCDGVVLGSVLADEWRPDLQQAGFGTGHHSFSFDIPGGLIPGQRYTIEVTTQDGQPLSGSPWTTKAIQAA